MGFFDRLKTVLGITQTHTTESISDNFENVSVDEPFSKTNFIIRYEDEEELQKLVDKYITSDIEENMGGVYHFPPSNPNRKYSNKEIRTKAEHIIMHFLYKCSANKQWVRDSVKPDTYFSNYSDLLVNLQILSEFERYFPFYKPLPSAQLSDYSQNREKYNTEFIKRWFESVTNQASSLKTIDGRQKRIKKSCEELFLYKNFLTINDIEQVNALSTSVNATDITKKEKPLPIFDSTKEKELLEVLRNSRSPQSKHFVYIELQNFYYKYRKNDAKYLELCKQYCEKDIALLPKVDEDYVKEQIQMIKRASRYHSSSSRAEDNREIERISRYGFNGTIPAFKRISIIYENEKNFDKAIEFCDAEIEHYLSHGFSANSDTILEVKKRREKLVVKKEKSKS